MFSVNLSLLLILFTPWGDKGSAASKQNKAAVNDPYKNGIMYGYSAISVNAELPVEIVVKMWYDPVEEMNAGGSETC